MMNKELLKLLRIKNDKVYYNILFNSLEESEKNEILSQLKPRNTLSRNNKKLEENKLISLVKNKYDEKIEPYINQIQENICPIYCKYGNMSMIIKLLMDMFDFADPTLISFIIKRIMNKICKCRAVGQIQRTI